jgi:UDP-glucose 4-epimerase
VSRDSVLLLGGTGFIGSALAARLKHEKKSFHVIGRNDTERLEEVLPLCGTVVHLACATTPTSSASHPDLERDNVALTSRLLALVHRQPNTHVIFFSSGGTVYGDPRRLPVTEDSPFAPLSNHGLGKASQEASCEAERAQGRAITVLRPSNAYGPGQGLKSGFGLVRTMLQHALVGSPVEIWGDGENIRDFIYIDDVVEACTRFIALPEDSGTYNLGTGVGFSVNDVMRQVQAATGEPLKAIYRPARGIDVRGVVLDTQRLRARLGWAPDVALADGLARTWKWLKHG